MLREKTVILAHLKKLRADDPARMRRLGAVALVATLGMATAVAVVPGSAEQPDLSEKVVEALGALPVEIRQDDARPFIREDRLRGSESLASLLRRMGVSDTEGLPKGKALDALQRTLNPIMRPGCMVTVATTAAGRLVSVSFVHGKNDHQVLLRQTAEGLRLEELALTLDSRVQMQGGSIESSLFATMDAIGLPDSVGEELARMFGDEIDFNTDLRKGDHFNVVYEVLYHAGRPVRTGRILSAEFYNKGVRHAAYLYTHPDGKAEYYDEQGKSRQEGFLRSPLEFSRVTSGFAMRLHPIQGIWKQHQGVDFGAPTGTAVKATAHGEVEFVGWQNGYGNFVVLRHGDKYTTAYGHLSGFAPRLKKGSSVNQGDVIGYVGTTGWATGPHLHYEFRINGVHQNPLTVGLPSVRPISGAALAQFRQQTTELKQQLAWAAGTSSARLD